MSCAVINVFGVVFAGFCSRFEVFLRCRVEGLFDVFSRTGGWYRCCSRRRKRVTPHMTRGICRSFLLRGGFSRVELGVQPYVDASACRRLGDLVEVCGSAFLFLEAAAVLVCVPEKTQSSSLYVTEPPQAARPNHLTAVYRLLQYESRQFSRAFGRQGLNRRRLISPLRQVHASGTSLLSAAF